MARSGQGVGLAWEGNSHRVQAPTHVALAVPAAMLAAGSFAVSAVLQQRAAREAPDEESISLRLILDLARQKTWLAGVVCVVVAYGLQAFAFAEAPIALVEPLVGLELVIALPLAARWRSKRLGVREWTGALFVVLGVGGFLAVSNPAGGNPEPSLVKWAVVVAPVALAVVLAVGLARMPKGPARAAMLAVGAGLTFALTALVTQSLVRLLGTDGISTAVVSWQFYALLVIGPLGFVIGQNAYQAGPLAVSLPIMDSLEPTMAIILAAIAFSEHVSLQLAHLAVELGGAALAIAGICLLGTSPLVHAVYAQTEREKRGGAGGDADPSGTEAAARSA